MVEPPFLDELRAAQRGNQQAMERLLERLRPHLEHVARQFANVVEPGASTADLVQEAVLRIWQRLDQFRGTDSAAETEAMFRDWAGQTVRHLAIDAGRRRLARRREAPGPVTPLDAGGRSESGGVDHHPADRGPTPSANVRADEAGERIRSAVATIVDATDRDIIRLCFFDGLSLRQIAERLALSYDKVRERYHRTLKRLERDLEGLL